MTARTRSAAEVLQPYVPRLVVSWLAETPDAKHRRVDGTLAFVDISGFTRLTERLARKGKVGSEEVSDTLDSCFGQLLSVAYDYGAGVVKWGGDAVLLLFTDPEHERRACRASWSMHRLLGKIGSLETSAGRVRLRMSTGIHSGAFDFFLAGSHHRELILTGPGASTTIAMEGAAEAGETVVSRSTAAALDSTLLGAPKAGGFLLARPPDVHPQRAGPAPDCRGLPLERLFSPAIRDHLLSEASAPEHRTVTTAFVDLQGLDARLAAAGSSAVADVLDECLQEVQDAALLHDVAFFDGDPTPGGAKIMLVAGAPRSSGNDEERMLRTLRRVFDRPRELPLRAGVSTGRVFADEFGPYYRRTYTVKGDAVNLAARLMAKAETGQILAHRAVIERSRTIFATEHVAPFRVKGKREPVEAVVVGAIAGSRAELREGPLVGRDRERALLRDDLDRARRGEGRADELVGETGIGKSRLVDDLCAFASGFAVLRTAGEEYESSTAYAAVQGMLRDLLGIRPGESPLVAAGQLEQRVESMAPHLLPWLPLLAIPFGIEVPPTAETERLDEKFRKSRLEQVAADFLAAMLGGPTLLVIEDVQWMDDASLDLLRALARDVARRPWLILSTRRPDGQPLAPDVSTISLGPLNAEAAEALILAATDDAPLPAHRVEALVERAGGNPLFLTELVASVGGLDVDELPDSVEALVAAQLDRLAPRDRAVLRHASVLGRSFDARFLVSVLDAVDEPPEPGTWDRLSDFLVREPRGLLRFRYALLRDAAYQGLPYRMRRELHARVADAIERLAGDGSPRDAAQLSLHFFHGQRYEKAWRYSRLAGDHARSIYAHAEAADFYLRALDAARHLPHVSSGDVAAVSESLGDSLERLGLFRDSAGAYRNARRHRGGDSVAGAALMLKEGWMAEREGRFSHALRWFTRGLRLLEGAEDESAGARRADLLAAYATVRQMQGRSVDAIRWCRAAIVAAEAAQERKALAQAYYVLDWAYMDLGRGAEAASLPLALAIYEELGDVPHQATVRELMGAFAYYEGRWEEAVALYGRARDDFETVGASVLRAADTFNIGEIRCDQGRLEEAEPLVQEALRVWRAASWPSMVATATRQLGTVAVRSGRLEQAARLFDEARAVFAEIGAQHELVDTDGRIAECLLLQGRAEGLEAAAGALQRGRTLSERSVHLPMLYRVAGYGRLLVGDRAGASEAFEESLRIGRDRRALFQIALTLDALARVAADPEEAGAFESERDSLLAELAVVSLPPAPAGELAIP